MKTNHHLSVVRPLDNPTLVQRKFGPIRRGFVFLAMLVGLWVSSTNTHAQYSADYQTNLISGVTSNWTDNGGWYYLGGLGGAYDRTTLIITNAGVLTDTYGHGERNVTVLVTGTGSVWSNSAILYFGDILGGCKLSITAGGNVLDGSGLIGSSSANSNTITIADPGSVWSNDYGFFAGYQGLGNALTISNGGAVVDSTGWIGFVAGADSNTVTMTGAVWSNSNDFIVGGEGFGNTLIIAGGSAVLDSNGYIGSNNNNNAVTVIGTGSIWTNTGNLSVGLSGSGNSLTIASNGTVFTVDGYIGNLSGANSNTVSVSGSGSLWTNAGNLSVGLGGSGNTLTIVSSGTVVSASGYVGNFPNANNNTAALTGAGSIWKCLGLYVGEYGTGNTLTISNQGLVAASSCMLGDQAGASNNAVTVSGIGSVLSNRNSIYVGYHGAGNMLTVRNGGTVIGPGTLGNSSDSINNSATVTGAGSVWSNSTLSVGQAGFGNTLTIAGSGTVSVLNFAYIGWGASSSNNIVRVTDSGSSFNCGTLTIGNSGSSNTLTIANGAVVVAKAITLGSGASSRSNLLAISDSILAVTNSAAGQLILFRGDLTITNGTVLAYTIWPTNGAWRMADGTLAVNTITTNNTSTNCMSGGTLQPFNANGNWAALLMISNSLTVNTSDWGGQPRTNTLSGKLINTGTINITGTGLLRVNSTNTGNGWINVQTGSTLGGTGWLANVQVQANAMLSAGLPAGTLRASNLVFSPWGQLQVQLNATTGIKGTQWNLVSVNGPVTMGGGGLALQMFVVNRGGLTGSAGPLNSVAWDILDATGGITGFDSNSVSFNITGLDGWTNGTWSVSQSGNSLYLNYNLLPVTLSVVADQPSHGAATGSGTYAPGSNVVLTATGTNGWVFTSWSDGMTANPYSITVPPTNYTYTANFIGCSYGLAVGSTNVAAGASSGSVNLTTSDGCPWSASASTNWLHTSSAGTGSGTVSYTFDDNTSNCMSRIGTITVGAQTFTIMQAAGTGSYSLTATNASLAAGDINHYFVNLTAGAGCTWTATSTSTNWLHTSGTGTGGIGTFFYWADDNSANSIGRTGTVTVGSATFTVAQAAGSCSYALTASSTNLTAGAGSGNVGITAGAGCVWTATSNTNWLHTTSTGTGSGTVNYTFDANTANCVGRTGTLTVGGRTYTVTQAAGTGDYSFVSVLTNVIVSAGSGSVRIAAGIGCSWTAVSSSTDWLHTSSTGTGTGTVSYTFDSNIANCSSRTGTITAASATLTVVQTAGTGSYNLSATSTNVADGSAAGSLVLTAGLGCSWTAVSSNTNWLHTTSTGTGYGTVDYLIDGNTFNCSGRTGTIVVAGLTFTVTQAAGSSPQAASIAGASTNLAASAGSGSLRVLAGDGCPWTATLSTNWVPANLANWIHTTSTGVGPGTISYTVDDNNSNCTARLGYIVVGSQSFMISQSAGSGDAQFVAASTNVAASAGSGSINLVAGTGCTWHPTTTSTNWLTITSIGNPVRYGFNTNPNCNSRSATITIGSQSNQTFTITQAGGTGSYGMPASTNITTASAGSGSVAISAGDGCAWTASSSTPWIHTTASGTGNGTIDYTFDANPIPNVTRLGTITVGGSSPTNEFLVVQKALPSANVTLTVTPADAATISVSGAYFGDTNYTDYAGSDGRIWRATSFAQTNLQITVTPNPYWIFMGWSDGETNATRTLTVPWTDSFYTANFLPQTSTVSIVTSPSNGGNPSIVRDCNLNFYHQLAAPITNGTYQVGSQQCLIAAPNWGPSQWGFRSWSDGDTNQYRIITMPPTNITYTASYYPLFTVTESIAASPTNGGTVSFLDNSQLTNQFFGPVFSLKNQFYNLSTLAAVFQKNAKAQFTAIAAPNWDFKGWEDFHNPLFTNATYLVDVTPLDWRNNTNTYAAIFVPHMVNVTTAVAPARNCGWVDGGGTYQSGTNIVLTALAGTNALNQTGLGLGWTFSAWSDGDTNNPRTITVPLTNISYTAKFTGTISNQTTVSLGTYYQGIVSLNGTPVSAANNGNFQCQEGSVVQLSVTATGKWTFISWMKYVPVPTFFGGTIAGTAFFSSNATINVGVMTPADGGTDAGLCNRWLAVFQNGTSTVTCVANPQFGGSVVGAGDYIAGTAVTLTATPANYYVFTGWSDGTMNSSYTITVPATDITYTANFLLPTGTVVVASSPTSGGWVSYSGINRVAVGTELDLMATPATYWHFDKWLLNGSTAILSNPFTVLVMSTNTISYTAQFLQDTATIIGVANPTKGGTVLGSGSGLVGSNMTLTAAPAPYYRFVSWSDGLTNSTRTITIPEGGATYTANFQPLTATITVIVNPAGSGGINGGGVYPINSSNVFLGAFANANWTFTNWSDGFTTNAITIGYARNAYRKIGTIVSNATYTANFTQQAGTAQIIINANPVDGGGTSGDGTYPVGTNVVLTASAAQYCSFISWNDGVTNAARTVRVPTTNITYTARFQHATGTFSGQVTDAATLLPVAGASVTWGTYNTTTDGGGNYQFSSVNWQTATCTVSQAGYLLTSQPYTLASSLATNNLTLIPQTPRLAIVQAAQRAGTKYVDITCSYFHPQALPMTDSVAISTNNGATFDLAINWITPANGGTNNPGNNLRITWNAAADFNNQLCSQVVIRVSASTTLFGQAITISTNSARLIVNTLSHSNAIPVVTDVVGMNSDTDANGQPVVYCSGPWHAGTQRICLLNGVTGFNLSFTPHVDWNGSTPGTIQFIKTVGANAYHSLDRTDTVADGVPSPSYDIGLDFGARGLLSVIAVAADGTPSRPFRVNLDVYAFPEWLSGTALYISKGKYQMPVVSQLASLVSFSKDTPNQDSQGRKMGEDWKGKKFDTSVSPSFSLDADVHGTFDVSLGLNVGKSGNAGGADGLSIMDIQASLSISGEVRGTPPPGAGTWIFTGNLSLQASLYINTPPIYPVDILPLYFEFGVGFDQGINAQFVYQNHDWQLSGTFPGDAYFKLVIGIGISDVIDVEGYGEMELFWTFQAPAKPFVYNLGLNFIEGVSVQFLWWTYDWSNTNTWYFINNDTASSIDINRTLASCLRAPEQQALKRLPKPAEFKANSRDYLDHASAGRARKALVRNRSTRRADVASSNSGVVNENVYPAAQPQLGVGGTNPVLLVWITDPGLVRSSENRTELVWQRMGINGWSTPQPVWDTGTADHAPVIGVFSNGTALAAWEKIARFQPAGATMEQIMAADAIAAAQFNPATGQWIATNLTDGTYYNHSPKLAVAANGTALLTWIGNGSNDMYGSASLPNTIFASRWNGAAWDATRVIATNVPMLLYSTVAYDGSNGVWIATLDGDDNLNTITDEELYGATYGNGTWSALTKLTQNTVQDTRPQAVYDSNGELFVAWYQGSNIVMRAGDLNLANAATVVALNGSSSTKDFRLITGPLGQISMVWQARAADGTGPDTFLANYDTTLNVWSFPLQLLSESNHLQRAINGAYANDGALLLAYNSVEVIPGSATNLARSGQVDLMLLNYRIEGDLAISDSDISLSTNAVPGQPVTISARVHNIGELAAANIAVAFYDGDPGAAGIPIGTQTIPGILPAGTNAIVSTTWNVPASTTSHILYVVVDPALAIPDRNLANNTASLSALAPDLQVDRISVAQLTVTNATITATIINAGTIPTPSPVNVTFRRGTPTGPVLATTPISPLPTTAQSAASFQWDMAGLTFTSGVELVVATVDEAHAVPQATPNRKKRSVTVLINLDSVGDGIPDWWRAKYFGGNGATTNAASCATCDPDHDGFSNLREYEASSIPTDKSSLPNPPMITTTSPLPTGTNGFPYSQQFQATGGQPPYKWTVTAGKLPTGFKLSTNGFFTASAAALGISNFRITVTDLDNQSAAKYVSLIIRNPTGPLVGTYTGLLLQTNMPTHASSGAIQIVVGKSASFAANLTLAGRKTAFKGQFDGNGNATNTVTGVTVALHADSDNGQITGTVTGTDFTAELLALLPNPTPEWQGTYTLLLPPADANLTNVPQGYGYATLTVSQTGSGSLSGMLNDGTKLSAKAPVLQSGLWPLYVPLAKNAGACIGWLSFETNTTAHAVVDWFAPSSKSYGAFTSTLTLTGSRYTTGPLMLSSQWAVTLSGGGYTNTVQAITFEPTGKVIGANPFGLKLTPKTGYFSGTFKPTGNGKAIPFSGLLLQDQAAGAGLFQSPNGQTGAVILEPVH